jgi:biopolymer transport protein ExbD
MATKIPEPDETEMNMTPMIDIVFQLIIFFLLSLKFKSVDRRIESYLPKDRGIQATQQFVEELPMVTVKLFRRNIEDADPDNDFTRIRVGNDFTFELMQGDWTGEALGADGDIKREENADQIFEKVEAAIRQIWGRMGNNPEAKGEIKTPRPFGLKVPHGDVIRVLDAFITVGLEDVKFEGAPAPLPTAGGGGSVTQGG